MPGPWEVRYKSKEDLPGIPRPDGMPKDPTEGWQLPDVAQPNRLISEAITPMELSDVDRSRTPMQMTPEEMQFGKKGSFPKQVDSYFKNAATRSTNDELTFGAMQQGLTQGWDVFASWMRNSPVGGWVGRGGDVSNVARQDIDKARQDLPFWSAAGHGGSYGWGGEVASHLDPGEVTNSVTDQKIIASQKLLEEMELIPKYYTNEITGKYEPVNEWQKKKFAEDMQPLADAIYGGLIYDPLLILDVGLTPTQVVKAFRLGHKLYTTSKRLATATGNKIEHIASSASLKTLDLVSPAPVVEAMARIPRNVDPAGAAIKDVYAKDMLKAINHYNLESQFDETEARKGYLAFIKSIIDRTEDFSAKPTPPNPAPKTPLDKPITDIKKRYDFHRLREHYFAHANAKSPARKAETFEELRTVVMQMYQDLDSPKFAVGESHIYDIFDPRTTRYYSDAELAEMGYVDDLILEKIDPFDADSNVSILDDVIGGGATATPEQVGDEIAAIDEAVNDLPKGAGKRKTSTNSKKKANNTKPKNKKQTTKKNDPAKKNVKKEADKTSEELAESHNGRATSIINEITEIMEGGEGRAVESNSINVEGIGDVPDPNTDIQGFIRFLERFDENTAEDIQDIVNFHVADKMNITAGDISAMAENMSTLSPNAAKHLTEKAEELSQLEIANIQAWLSTSDDAIEAAIKVLDDADFSESPNIIANIANGENLDHIPTREAVEFFTRRADTSTGRFIPAGFQANRDTASMAKGKRTPSLGSRMESNLQGEISEVITTYATHHEFILLNKNTVYPVKVRIPITPDNDIYVNQIMLDPNQRVIHKDAPLRVSISAMFDFYGNVNMPALLKKNPTLALEFNERVAQEWSQLAAHIAELKNLKQVYQSGDIIRTKRQKGFIKKKQRKLSIIINQFEKDLKDWHLEKSVEFAGLKKYNQAVSKYADDLRKMIAEHKKPSRAKFQHINDPLFDLPSDTEIIPLLDIAPPKTAITPANIFNKNMFVDNAARMLADDDFNFLTNEEIMDLPPGAVEKYTDAMILYTGAKYSVIDVDADVADIKRIAYQSSQGNSSVDNITGDYGVTLAMRGVETALQGNDSEEIGKAAATLIGQLREPKQLVEDSEAAVKILERAEGGSAGGGTYPPTGQPLFSSLPDDDPVLVDESSAVGMFFEFKRWAESWISDDLAQPINVASRLEHNNEKISGVHMLGEQKFEVLAANMPGLEPYIEDMVKTIFFKLRRFADSTESYKAQNAIDKMGMAWFEENLDTLLFLHHQRDVQRNYPKRKFIVDHSYRKGADGTRGSRKFETPEEIDDEINAFADEILSQQSKLTGRSIKQIKDAGQEDFKKLMEAKKVITEHYDFILKIMVEQGSTTLEEYKLLRTLYPNWIPTKMDGLIRSLRKGNPDGSFSDPRQILHRFEDTMDFEGKQLSYERPLSNILTHTKWTLDRSMQNKLIRTYIDNIMGYNSEVLQEGGEFSVGGRTVNLAPHDEELKNLNVKHIYRLEVSGKNNDISIPQRDKIYGLMDESAKVGSNTVYIKRNGVTEAYYLPGQHVNYLNFLIKGGRGKLNPLSQAFNQGANMPWKAAYVGLNPAFIHAELPLNIITAMLRGRPHAVGWHALKGLLWDSWMNAIRNTVDIHDAKTLAEGGNITLSRSMSRTEMSRAERDIGKQRWKQYQGSKFVNTILFRDKSFKRKMGYLGTMPDGYRLEIAANNWAAFRKHPLAMISRFYANYRNALEQVPRIAATKAAAGRKVRDTESGLKELRYGVFETYEDAQGITRYSHDPDTLKRIPVMDDKGTQMLDWASLAQERRRSTIDFSRGGKLFKILDPYFAFANVAAQGALQIPARNISHGFRQAKNLRPGAAGVAAGTMGALAGGTTVIYAAWTAQAGAFVWNMKFPEYWDVPIWDRFGPLIMLDSDPDKINPDTGRPYPRYVTLPFPERQLSMFFGPAQYMMEKLYNTLDAETDNPVSTFTEMMDHVLKQSSPWSFTDSIPDFGTWQHFVPGVGLRMVADIASNRKTFTGAPVVPEYMRDWEKKDQIDENTTATAQAVSQAASFLSPMEWQYVMDQFGVFREFITVTDYIALSQEYGVRPSSVRHAEAIVGLIAAQPNPEQRVTILRSYLNQELDSVQIRNEVESIVNRMLEGRPTQADVTGDSFRQWPIMNSFVRRSYHDSNAINRKWTARERAEQGLDINSDENLRKLTMSRLQEARSDRDIAYDEMQTEFNEHGSERLFRARKQAIDLQYSGIRLSLMDDDELDNYGLQQDKQIALNDYYNAQMAKWGDDRANRIEMHVSHWISIQPGKFLDGLDDLGSMYRARDEFQLDIISKYGMEEWELVNARLTANMTPLEERFHRVRQEVISPFYSETREYVLDRVKRASLQGTALVDLYIRMEEAGSIEQSMIRQQNPQVDEVIAKIDSGIQKVRLGVRARNPRVDEELIRWRYTTAPQSVRGLQLLQELERKEALYGTNKTSLNNDPYSRWSL